MRGTASEQRGRGTRRAALGAVVALVLGLGLAPALAVATATPASAADLSIAVAAKLEAHRGTNGRGVLDPDNSWLNPDRNVDQNCIRFAPAAGTWSAGAVRAAHGGGGLNIIGQRDCSSSLSTTSQSAIEFASRASTNAAPTGASFLLGTFRHYNNPIQATATFFEGTFGVRVGTTETTATYVLEETDNNSSTKSPDDIVTFSNLVRTSDVTIGTMRYRLSIQGFSRAGTGNATCPSGPGASSLSSVVTTVENTTTVACLWARLDQVRPVTVVKQVAAAGDAPTGAIPATSFTSASTVPGSPWAASSFTLTPTKFTGAESSATLAAREFRGTGEQLTITEGVPATNWELSSIECRDGAGTDLPSGATVSLADRRVILENVPDAATATAVPITCTFRNTYVAPTTLTLVSTTTPAGGAAVPTADWTFAVDAVATPLVTAGAGGSATATIPVAGATRVVRITETVKPGFVVGGVSCRRNDQTAASFTGTTNPYDLTLERGRSYTCTVANLRPSVTLAKEAFLATDTAFANPLATAQQRQAGTALVWRYTIRNTGQTTLTGIVLRDQVTVTPQGGTGVPSAAHITCPSIPGVTPGPAVTLPPLAPGQSVHCQSSGVL